jgi:hypothetical protein
MDLKGLARPCSTTALAAEGVCCVSRFARAGAGQGLALYFGPHSYTGEDVLELHAPGGPVV